jgi:hypothetical protein
MLVTYNIVLSLITKTNQGRSPTASTFPSPDAYKRVAPSPSSPCTALGHSLSPPLDPIELDAIASLLSGELLPPLSGGLESN